MKLVSEKNPIYPRLQSLLLLLFQEKIDLMLMSVQEF
ncbi:MAG: hypothetical protein RIT11_250 [Pseudomonadota bacterium]